MEEAVFAREFFSFDQSLEKTIFLSPNPGKMAEFSNKIPFNLYSSHTISQVALLYYDQDKFLELEEREKEWTQIINNSCVSCLENISARYIVVKNGYFNGQIDLSKVFSSGNFIVYETSIDLGQ